MKIFFDAVWLLIGYNPGVRLGSGDCVKVLIGTRLWEKRVWERVYRQAFMGRRLWGGVDGKVLMGRCLWVEK